MNKSTLQNPFPRFNPPFFLRPTGVQTTLASARLRALGKNSMLDMENIREMTVRLLEKYSTLDNEREYFKRYTLLENDLQGINVPTTTITAEDDPIIPVEDFYDLIISDATRLIIHPYGGHNGFIQGWRLNGWYEEVMANLFQLCLQ